MEDDLFFGKKEWKSATSNVSTDYGLNLIFPHTFPVIRSQNGDTLVLNSVITTIDACPLARKLWTGITVFIATSERGQDGRRSVTRVLSIVSRAAFESGQCLEKVPRRDELAYGRA